MRSETHGEWLIGKLLNTSTEHMPPEEVAKARDALGVSGKEFAKLIGASARQHTYRAEREGGPGLNGCQARTARILLEAANE